MTKTMTKRLHRHCPVCGATAARILSCQHFLLPEKHPLPNSFDVVICEVCNFAFADTPASQETYDRYYTDFSKYEDDATSTGGGGNPSDWKRLEDTAGLLAAYAAKDTPVLDMGCANGGLLKAFQELGFEDLTGVDPSPVCAAATAKSGCKGVAGSLFAPPVPMGHFGLVILSHVLEHIRDLGQAAKLLTHLVRPGGLLYIEVPDASRYEGYSRAPFQDFNVEHINHFSHAALENLFRQKGFVPVAEGIRDIGTEAGWTYPAIWNLFRLESGNRSTEWIQDQGLGEALVSYTKASEALLAGIDFKLLGLVESQTPLIVWGVGQLTLKLLAQSLLGRCNIVAFTDGNPSHHGKTINGSKVIAPAELAGLPHPILIGTLLHHEAISTRIRQGLDLPNPIITL
jgi:SAM-dependent methyltransferase